MECTEQLCVGVRPRVHLRNLVTGFEEMWGANPVWNLISFLIDCVKPELNVKLQSTFIDFFNFFFFFFKVLVRVKGVEISLTSVCLNRRSCKLLYAEYTMNKIIF